MDLFEGWTLPQEMFEELFEELAECYELVYPVGVWAGNTLFEATDFTELTDLIEDENINQFAFPIQVINSDSVTLTIKNNGQLNQALEDCE